MYQATFRFYAELTDFLPAAAVAGHFAREFNGSPSVKDQIEACGIPHTEVDLVLANGKSVDFSYRLADGDRISVYPMFESFDIGSVSMVRPAPLRTMRFLVDINLGKLARYLRLFGFDASCDGRLGDADLAATAAEQRRILLTKDRGLLKRAEVTHGYLVREIAPRQQIVEVLRRFDLAGSIEPFARCLECNGEIESVGKADIEHLLEPLTKRYFEHFRRCRDCRRIFWRGSHFERLAAMVSDVRRKLGSINAPAARP